MIKNYAINSWVTPVELQNAGFYKVNLLSRGETYRLRTYLYERAISLRITIEFPDNKEENLYVGIDIWDEYNNQLYPAMYNDYGKNELKEYVTEQYIRKMNKLVEKNIFNEV